MFLLIEINVRCNIGTDESPYLSQHQRSQGSNSQFEILCARALIHTAKIHTHELTNTHTNTNKHKHTYENTHTNIHTIAYIHKLIHTRAHARTHTHTHTHIYIYAHNKIRCRFYKVTDYVLYTTNTSYNGVDTFC